MTRPPSSITKIEHQLIEHIKRYAASSFYVQQFPANPHDFDPAKMNAAILVHYSGSQYGPPNGMDASSQPRELRFTIVLYLHSLGDVSDAYDHLEDIRLALQNVPLEGGTPIKLISDQLTGQEAGQWEWQVEVATAIEAIANHHKHHYPRANLNRFEERPNE